MSLHDVVIYKFFTQSPISAYGCTCTCVCISLSGMFMYKIMQIIGNKSLQYRSCVGIIFSVFTAFERRNCIV